MSEWKTIDSVPKDGRAVMVWVANGHITPHCFAPISITSDGSWWDDSTGDQLEPIAGATHWMTLPGAPAQPDTAKDETR